jgi:hypothetical protein
MGKMFKVTQEVGSQKREGQMQKFEPWCAQSEDQV